MRRNSYDWLVGYNMGVWIYDGTAIDDNGRTQYCFIGADGYMAFTFMYYNEFIEYISGYSLPQHRKLSWE